jgi:hypothetical protein
MIDDPDKTEWLLSELEAALPVEALVSPPLVATLRDCAPGLQPFQRCKITKLHYTGDQGGILCCLDLADAMAPDCNEVVLVSITHLMFDRRAPLARQIASYQKRRLSRIRRGTAA